MKNIQNFSIFTVVLILLTVLVCFNGKVFAFGNTDSALSDISITGNQDAAFFNGILRITTGGKYILSGEHTGQIIVQAARNDVVELVLNNLILHNPDGPAIYAPRSQRVELILPDGTINTISDGRHLNDENNAAIYVQHDLIISGNGMLHIAGNYRHGIRVHDTLTIDSGVITVRAVGDALRGRDGVIIEDGTFTLNAGGDGIQSNRESNPEQGYITINGGTFIIAAEDDGIQAEGAITINNGSISIKAKDDGITSSGSVLITGGDIHIIDSYEGIEGHSVTITGGNINIFARDDGINARNGGAVTTGRAVIAGRAAIHSPARENIYVRITGGNINVRALRDGIDSNNNFFLEGGTLHISGPSRGREGAIDVDGSVYITGGELITAGSVINISAQSTQPVLLFTYSQQLPIGTLIEVKDKKSATLLNYTAEIAFSMSGFTSPNFVLGDTYSLNINGEKMEELTLNSIITNIGDGSLRSGRDGTGSIRRR